MSDGWQALDSAIAAARAAVAAEAPDPGTAAEGEAYVARVVTSALAASFMAHRLTHGGLTTPLPVDTFFNVLAIRRANSVDFFVCPRMGHMHNFASTRALFWERIHRFGTLCSSDQG